MADRFLDFIDMIDGGGYGEGKMGDKFEGGGIFSMLANALATPYGSEDDERRRKLRQMRGLLAPDESIAPSAAPRPTVTRGGGAGQAQAQVRPQARPAQSMPFGSTPVGGGMPAAQNYESTMSQMRVMGRHPVDYRSQHVREAVSDVFEREKERANNLGILYREGSDALNRYYAQKHMAYSGQPMSKLTDPSADGIPNIERLMPPVNGAPQAAQNMVRPEMPASGMPVAAADPEFAQFMERAKQDPMMSQFIDNASAMQNIFEMYKQQLSTGRMY